jgi:hypothetical protein
MFQTMFIFFNRWLYTNSVLQVHHLGMHNVWRDPAAPAGYSSIPNGVQINGFSNGTNVPMLTG